MLYQLSYLPKFASARAHLHKDFSIYFLSLKLDFEESFIARHLAKLRDYNPFAAPLAFDQTHPKTVWCLVLDLNQ